MDGCIGRPCRRDDWLAFLSASQLAELAAPPGGRAYRWIWSTDGFQGFVELSVTPDGSGSLRSSSSVRRRKVAPSDVARFEAALAKSTFGELPPEDSIGRSSVLDYPPEQLMEADVAGRYRFVHRFFGLPEDVRQAGVILEHIASVG